MWLDQKPGAWEGASAWFRTKNSDASCQRDRRTIFAVIELSMFLSVSCPDLGQPGSGLLGQRRPEGSETGT